MLAAPDPTSLLSRASWSPPEVAHALALSKLHDDAPTRKQLKSLLEARAASSLAALQTTWKASLGSDDKKFTKALETVAEDAFDRVAFARACFALSRGHLGYAFRVARGGAIARQALEDDLDAEGMLRIAKVKTLPPELASVEGLRTLALWKVPLKKLPPLLGQLTSLERLELSAMPIASFGDVLKPLARLRSIRLDDVPLAAVGQLPAITSLEVLGAFTVDPAALCLPGLEQLALNPGSPKALPAQVGELRDLRSLHFRGATALPDALFRLVRLEHLDLSGLELASLPDAIGALRGLRRLSLSGSKSLTALPASLAELSALEELDLVFCASLAGPPPAWLGKLGALRRLRVQYSPWDQFQDQLRAVLPQVTIYR